jgi:hypothetical protein
VVRVTARITGRSGEQTEGGGVEATATITDGQMCAVSVVWCAWSPTDPVALDRERAGYIEAARRATEQATEKARHVLAGMRAGGAS